MAHVFSYYDLLSTYLIFKKCQLLQLGTGISANTFLLLFHIFRPLMDLRPKATDLTISHLAFVHIMQLLTALFLSPDLFESLNIQDDLKCKALFYMGRVTKSLSTGTTCVLSVLQAFTISCSTTWFEQWKHKFVSFKFQLFFFIWFISLSLNSYVIFYTVASSNVTQESLLNVNNYCSISLMKSSVQGLVFTLNLFREISFVGTMLLSSAYMMLFLMRHQRRCQHLHRSSFSKKISPEKRATKTILLMSSFFVVIYLVDFLISSVSMLSRTHDPVMLCVHGIVVNFYATLSSFVLITSDKRILSILKTSC